MTAIDNNSQSPGIGRAAPQRLALILVVGDPEGPVKRKAFLTAASAERSLAAALAAGRPASVVLCQLVPLALWDGSEGGLDA